MRTGLTRKEIIKLYRKSMKRNTLSKILHGDDDDA